LHCPQTTQHSEKALTSALLRHLHKAMRRQASGYNGSSRLRLLRVMMRRRRQRRRKQQLLMMMRHLKVDL